jgi:hypothetical protein
MDKKKLAIGILLLLAVPLVLFSVVNLVGSFVPVLESYKKTPYQFEEAFNEQMADYGMSIDIDSVHFVHGSSFSYKIVPVQCEDGSQITCTYRPTDEGRNSFVRWIEFEQQLTGDVDETIYIEQLLDFLMREFETPLIDGQNRYYNDYDKPLSYESALETCRDFIAGKTIENSFYVRAYEDNFDTVTLKRGDAEKPSITLRLSILMSY